MTQIKREIVIPEHNETKCILMCDLCRREESDKTWIYRCIICGKDVCSDCSIYVVDDPWTIMYDDTHICDVCAKSDYMEQLSIIDVHYTNAVESIVRKWKAEIKKIGDE